MPARTIPVVAVSTSAPIRGWWWAGLLLCLLMLVVHVFAGTNTGGMADFWRDMYWAASIAHGEQFPLAGPQIYQLFELGPWWFYLLALPMALGGGVASAAAFAQALAAAKYVLAWRLGRRIAGDRFGFVLAASLVVAGWSMLPLMFPSHTGLVETMLLLLVFAAWRSWERFGAGEALLFGLAVAGCLHAHPTTVVPVAIAGTALLGRHRSRSACAWMFLSVVIVAASLAPPWLHADGAADALLKPVPDYVRDDMGVDVLARVPGVVRSLVIGGAWWGLLLLTKWNVATVTIGWWTYCACVFAAGAGLLRLRRREPRLFGLGLAALAVFLAQVVFLVLARPITPMWMVAAGLPPLGFAIALGWHGWLIDVRPGVRCAAIAGLGLQLALALVPFSVELRDLESVRVMPGVNPFYNVIESSDRHVTIQVPFYPVRRFDALASALCRPVVLHGRVAALAESSFAVPMRNACGKWPALRYGGVEGAGPHVAGLLPRMAAAIGIEPAREVAGMALYEGVRAIAPAEGGRPAPLRRLQINPDSGAPLGEFAFEFEAGGGDVVLLTNRMPSAAPMERRQVEVEGKDALLLGEDGSAYAYGCPACDAGTSLHWRVLVHGIESNLDLVVLTAHPASGAR